MQVHIDRMDHFGNGIGNINGKIIFVKEALPGETVDVTITKDKKSFMEGTINTIIYKSSKRVEPFCKYFGVCGGCSLCHLNYENTLEYKKERVKNILSKFDIPKINVIRNENDLYYRNKIELKIVDGKLGFYEKSTHNLIEIKDCKVTKKSINKSFEFVKNMKLENANVTIRANYNDEVLIIIDSKEKPVILNPEDYKIVGIVLNDKCIYGQDNFMEKINNLFFTVSYNSFFQVNNYINLELFNLIKENIVGKTVLDLYSGVGTLSIVASKVVDKVYSIEVTQNAVKNALINAKINKCDNINFILGKVEDKIGFINDKIDTIIVDPARAGLDKKTIEVINNICPQRIIYVSCDTQSLANNLVDLANYEIKKFYILDMFSYTYHIECFCILDRK
ncbi:MAG: class I SAM-dependent RNA methyltransferase [Bacilli bacterium]|nr:class I SAM-dependent RNA methyltransferase [Bacilli bacterium]